MSVDLVDPSDVVINNSGEDLELALSGNIKRKTVHNIAEHLIERAAQTPHLPAVVCSLGEGPDGRRRYSHLSFAQLNAESAQVAAGLKSLGVARGTKALLMVRPGPDLFALTFGLFKAGVVPVLIDPGMDRRDLKECIAHAAPDICIGIPVAHLARKLLGWGRESVKRSFMVRERRRGLGALLLSPLLKLLAAERLDDIKRAGADAPADYLDERDPDALAAILYTSGSTGAPKGAEYRHRHFAAQVELLRALYPFREGAFDVPTFPLFALFDPALGMSALFPQMDYSAPATANPRELFAVIDDFGAENLFCSPALLRVIAAELERAPRALPTMRRVISAGAPVPAAEMKRVRDACHPEAEIFTPYGATESLPLTSVSCAEVIERGVRGQRAGRGVCVGRPPAGVHLRVIEVTDAPILSWGEARVIDRALSDDDELTPASAAALVGEVVVYAPSTTQNYLGRPEADRVSKIEGPPPGVEALEGQRVSHRMGDLGYFDADGYLWLCGRKSHRVDLRDTTGDDAPVSQRWLPLCVEGVAEAVSGVKRAALAEHPRGPILCVERSNERGWAETRAELFELIETHPSLLGLLGVAPHPRFPVDTRHNAKIKRELLSQWARDARVEWHTTE